MTGGNCAGIGLGGVAGGWPGAPAAAPDAAGPVCPDVAAVVCPAGALRHAPIENAVRSRSATALDFTETSKCWGCKHSILTFATCHHAWSRLRWRVLLV